MKCVHIVCNFNPVGWEDILSGDFNPVGRDDILSGDFNTVEWDDILFVLQIQ